MLSFFRNKYVLAGSAVLFILIAINTVIPNRNRYLQSLTFPEYMSSEFSNGNAGSPTWLCVTAIDSPCTSPSVYLNFEAFTTRDKVINDITRSFESQNLTYLKQRSRELQEYNSAVPAVPPKTTGIRTFTYYQVHKTVRDGCKYLVVYIDEELVTGGRNKISKTPSGDLARVFCVTDTEKQT